MASERGKSRLRKILRLLLTFKISSFFSAFFGQQHHDVKGIRRIFYRFFFSSPLSRSLSGRLRVCFSYSQLAYSSSFHRDRWCDGWSWRLSEEISGFRALHNACLRTANTVCKQRISNGHREREKLKENITGVACPSSSRVVALGRRCAIRILWSFRVRARLIMNSIPVGSPSLSPDPSINNTPKMF